MMAMATKFRVDNKPQELHSGEDVKFLDTYGDKFDFSDKSTIKLLVEYVRKMQTEVEHD